MKLVNRITIIAVVIMVGSYSCVTPYINNLDLGDLLFLLSIGLFIYPLFYWTKALFKSEYNPYRGFWRLIASAKRIAKEELNK